MKLWQLVQTASGLSRRRAQDLIRAGEVERGARPLTDPFATVEDGETVYLRGQPLCLQPRRFRVYWYYKPRGVLCSHDDPHTGNTVGRILRREGFIGYTWAGRLDRDAEGLMLLTNDGTLVARLTHPRYGVEKVYHVWTDPPMSAQVTPVFGRMQVGITDNGDHLRILSGWVDGRKAIVTLGQGHNREVKRLFAHFGFTVTRLRRVAIGPVHLPSTARAGEIARLEQATMHELYTKAGLNSSAGL